MIVSAPLAPGRVVTPADLADVAPCSDVRWGADGMLKLTFDRDLTADEVARVRARCMSGSGAEEQLRVAALNAMADNRAFLALTSPTAAQSVAQTRALTRQIQAVLRLVTGRFDGTD